MSFRRVRALILILVVVCISAIAILISLGLYNSDVIPLNDLKPTYIVQERQTIGHAELEGAQLTAFLAAHADFARDEGVPARKKDLKNYSIELSQENIYYVIDFIPKRLPSEAGQADGGEGVLGKHVTYWVFKNTGKIAKSTFYK